MIPASLRLLDLPPSRRELRRRRQRLAALAWTLVLVLLAAAGLLAHATWQIWPRPVL